MKLKWNGHSCFTLKFENGTTIVTDPFDPSVGYVCPEDETDFVTVSHHHHDHDYTDSLRGGKLVTDKAGVYELGGIKVSAIKSYHDDAQGKKRGENLIFKFEYNGISIVHLGDIGHYPDAEQLKFISGADVMLIPVGGFYTIDTDTALKTVKAAQPKLAIPMHFKTPEINFPISDEKRFAKQTAAVYVNAREIEPGALSGAMVLNYK